MRRTCIVCLLAALACGSAASAAQWKYAPAPAGQAPILTAHEVLLMPQGSSILVVTRFELDGTIRAAAGVWGRGGLGLFFAQVREARDPSALLADPVAAFADPSAFLPGQPCQIDATDTFSCAESGFLPGLGHFTPARPALPIVVPDLVSGSYRLLDAGGVPDEVVFADLVNLGEQRGPHLLLVLVDSARRYRVFGGPVLVVLNGSSDAPLQEARNPRLVVRRPLLALGGSPATYFRQDVTCKVTLALGHDPSFVCRDAAQQEVRRGTLHRLR